MFSSYDRMKPLSSTNISGDRALDFKVYGKPFWTKAVEFSSDGRDFSRTVEIFLGRSRFSSDGRDFPRTVETFLGRSRFSSDGRDFSRTVEILHFFTGSSFSLEQSAFSFGVIVKKKKISGTVDVSE